MGYFIYNCIVVAGFLLLLPFLPLFYLLGNRYHEGLAERLGFYRKAKVDSVRGTKPIWIHAASVGEVRAVSHLAGELRRRCPGRTIVATTFTATGNRSAREMGIADVVLFLPLDLMWTVRRALTQIDPAALIIVETEIWPNLLREAHRKGIPALLLSGRLSARAWRKYSWFGGFFGHVVRYFTAVGTQTRQDRERIVKLGAQPERVSIVGNLKQVFSDGQRMPGVSTCGTTHSVRNAGDSLWLVAGSSHRGEEEILIEAYIALRARFPGLRLVLAPRHPQRFAEVERLIKATGLSFEKKSRINGRLDFQTEVMLVDTLGDLQDFYAAGDIAFVGGSFVAAGGHNLLEPARFAKPVIFGPHMTNFKALARQMAVRGGGVEVGGKEEFIHAVTTLLTDGETRRSMGQKAFEVAAADPGVLERSMAMAERFLPPSEL